MKEIYKPGRFRDLQVLNLSKLQLGDISKKVGRLWEIRMNKAGNPTKEYFLLICMCACVCFLTFKIRLGLL